MTEVQGATVIAGLVQLSDQLHGLAAYLFVFTLLMLSLQAALLVTALALVRRG